MEAEEEKSCHEAETTEPSILSSGQLECRSDTVHVNSDEPCVSVSFTNPKSTTSENGKVKDYQENVRRDASLLLDAGNKNEMMEENSTLTEKEENLPATSTNSMESFEATTSQDNTSPCSYENESSISGLVEKFRRSMSKCKPNGDSGISIEKSGNSSDEESNDSNEWTTVSEDELDEEDKDEDDDEIPPCLQKEKPKYNWFIVPEFFRREIGNSPLFQRRFYGSLHAVERLELMYKLNEHQGSVNTISFNQKGNLLASGSDDLKVVIWDWAIGKKHMSFDSGHRSNLFQAKWLPLDSEYLMATSARDGEVRLLDLYRGTTRNLVAHHGAIHKISVHLETPHVIISVGENAQVLSIDVRDNKPTQLLTVNNGTSPVPLYTVHSNPLNSNEFCVGGRDRAVQIYDRRKVPTPLNVLYPDHIINDDVTSAVYNYNGTEILASYNDEYIYLFDTAIQNPGEFAHRYEGHRNTTAIKDVNFFGPKSEFVCSGSDCGNIFIWDKNTEAIVQWMPGDEQKVVNCLEPHPHIPILAASGLDYDVKIWVPSCEQPPDMADLEFCVRTNYMPPNWDVDGVPQHVSDILFYMILGSAWPHSQRRMRPRNARRESDDSN